MIYIFKKKNKQNKTEHRKGDDKKKLSDFVIISLKPLKVYTVNVDG